MRENPELYRAIKQSAIEHGMLAAPRPNPWAGHGRNTTGKPDPDRLLSDEEITARQQFTQAEIHAILTKNANEPGQSYSELAKDPEKLAVFRLAARSYGELPESSQVEVRDNRPKYAPKPAANDSRFQLSDDFCDRLNLPRGYKTDSTQFELIMRLLTEKKSGNDSGAPAAPAASDAPATEPEKK